MSTPLITIITVCYNSEKTIRSTIKSVLNQSYKNIEYIFIDGQSTDNTFGIIKEYEDEFKKKQILYKWVSEPDKNVYDAMNKGVISANGDWIYFLGSDDILYDVLYKFLDQFQGKTIYYGDVYMSKRGGIYHSDFNALSLCRNNVCHQSVFYPSAVFKKYIFELKYISYADWYLNIICCADKEFKIKYIPYVIAKFEEGGISDKIGDPLFLSDLNNIIKLNLPWYVYLYTKIRFMITKYFKIILKYE